jgi:aldose 1-epimerase
VPPPPGPWDDCFVGVEAPPVLRWPDGPTLRLESTTDCWVVYDETDHAVCLEPHTAPPDAFHLGGRAVLSPGESVSLPLRLVWDA